MNVSSPNLTIDDQYHIKLAQSLIASCSNNGLDYSSLKNVIDNSLNKNVDVLISFLHNNLDENSFQKELSIMTVDPFRRLAEEIMNYKKKTEITINKSAMKEYELKLNTFKKQEEKLRLIQETIIVAAKHSTSEKVKSVLNSIDLSGPEITQDKLVEMLIVLLQEGENTAQKRMLNLWSNISKTFNSKEEINKSMPIEKSEKLILQTVQAIKKKVHQYTQKSLKNNVAQTQLIKTLESQVEDLKRAIHFKKEEELFEYDIKKKFEAIESHENRKFDELFVKYKEAFSKIEEVTNSKNELLVRNGDLETENLILQQKFNDSIKENNQLKQTIEGYQSKNRKSH